MKPALARVLRDPLLWFALLGGACFALYAAFGQPRTRIEIGRPVQQSLREEYELMHGKPPDAAEMARLIDRYATDEILFQEALERGLLVNDLKTKERMVDKMRFMLAGQAEEPQEADLLDFYARHRDWYTSERKLSFDQVFFERPPARPQQVLERLKAGEAVAGDEFWLGDEFEQYSESMLRGLMGNEYADRLLASPRGEWSGPYASSRGTHFVRLREIAAPALVPFATVQPQVAQDWIAERRERDVQAKLQDVRHRYEVHVSP